MLTVDLRNHGASPWADTMGYFEMADDVQRLIEREGLRQPAVMGHSMGGKVAMALALLHPQCVGRLIVVDIAPVAYADRLSPFAEAMRSIDMLAAASRSEVQRRLAETVPDAGVVPFLMQNLVMRNAHLDWRINLAGIAASIGALSDFPLELRSLRFGGPLHVIAGGRSDYVAHRDGVRLPADVRRGRRSTSSRKPATGCMPTRRSAFWCIGPARARRRDWTRHPRRRRGLTDHEETRHGRQPARSRTRIPPRTRRRARSRSLRPRRWPPQRDLALAYSPGVADACMEIARDPAEAMNLTSRANLVAVITNGTAVLGLGNIGPLAGKPVMEGKACLFKKFAGIDVFDIELAENDPDALIDTIARMEPTFGGINLEDIKAPECFYIETKLRERMKIPVFHDDQHGTAIVAAAAILNALKHVGKDIAEVKLVASGAGAAALACLDLIVSLGLPMRNIFVSDSAGVVYVGRKEQMDPNKARYAQQTTGTQAGRHHRRRRRVPRPVGRRRAQARDGRR